MRGLPVARLPAGWVPATDALADRVVLVTGAYGGLGSAVARAVARAGATVVITGKRKRQLEQLYDAMLAEGLSEPVIHPLDMEVATPREYAALAEGLERDLGRPIALVDESMPVIVVAPSDELVEKTLSNMHEVSARGGKIILITDEEGARTVGQGVTDIIVMPKAHPFVAPILSLIPVQLLAYHTAVAMGTDVDQPRNLAKSVTVE